MYDWFLNFSCMLNHGRNEIVVWVVGAYLVNDLLNIPQDFPTQSQWFKFVREEMLPETTSTHQLIHSPDMMTPENWGVVGIKRGVSPKTIPFKCGESIFWISAERGVIPLGVHLFGWMLSLLGQLQPMMSICRLRWCPLKKHLWLWLWYGSKVSCKWMHLMYIPLAKFRIQFSPSL